jgi:hypothetical protein
MRSAQTGSSSKRGSLVRHVTTQGCRASEVARIPRVEAGGAGTIRAGPRERARMLRTVRTAGRALSRAERIQERTWRKRLVPQWRCRLETRRAFVGMRANQKQWRASGRGAKRSSPELAGFARRSGRGDHPRPERPGTRACESVVRSGQGNAWLKMTRSAWKLMMAGWSVFDRRGERARCVSRSVVRRGGSPEVLKTPVGSGEGRRAVKLESGGLERVRPG